jgi:hypothetical protein
MKFVRKAFRVFSLGMPFVLLMLPADYFDNGTTVCPSKALLDIECPGCGLTRGVMHLIHFDFLAAWEFNKLSFIIVPLGIMLWFHILGKVINRPMFSFIDEWY